MKPIIKQNIENLFLQTKTNNLGEKVNVVLATKTVDTEYINYAISLGAKSVGENKVQEFNEKFEFLSKDADIHFIGHLQKNKVKYLVGKVNLIHSVDSYDLAFEIDKVCKNKNVENTNILLQVNVGNELTKSGLNYNDALTTLTEVSKLPHITVKGFMAMLPNSSNELYLANLCTKMRELFDSAKNILPTIEYLSMGMSNDYLIAINNGSNMIRVGSIIFGKREYKEM